MTATNTNHAVRGKTDVTRVKKVAIVSDASLSTMSLNREDSRENARERMGRTNRMARGHATHYSGIYRGGDRVQPSS